MFESIPPSFLLSWQDILKNLLYKGKKLCSRQCIFPDDSRGNHGSGIAGGL